MEPREWDCAWGASVVVLLVRPQGAAAVAAVGRRERCLTAVCELLVMSKAVACRGEPDAVGACGWNGSWGRRRLSVCSGWYPCLK